MDGKVRAAAPSEHVRRHGARGRSWDGNSQRHRHVRGIHVGAAVISANANAEANTISFAAGLTGTLTLQSGQLEISNTSGLFTIVGPGPGSLSISGANAGRVFAIDSGASVAVSGLTITEGGFGPGDIGGEQFGGAVYHVGAALTITNCLIVGNYANTGAAIYDAGPMLTVTDSQIANNQANGAALNNSTEYRK